MIKSKTEGSNCEFVCYEEINRDLKRILILTYI
jgi:hypothetical protein